MNPEQQTDYDLDEIVPLVEYVERYPNRPWPTLSGARWAVHNRKNNGLTESGALIKLGGRIFIHKPTMFNWLMNSKYE